MEKDAVVVRYAHEQVAGAIVRAESTFCGFTHICHGKKSLGANTY